jgi:hypothetical protein
MSATIIAFPTKPPALENRSRYHVDFSPVDKRGLVILDTCVPPALAAELMTLIDRYGEKETAPVRSGVPPYDLPKFSFHILQSGRDLVLVEACVPQQLASEFLAIAEVEATPATAA